MRTWSTAILILALACGLPQRISPAEASGDNASSVLTRPPRGSLAAQLRLKLSLQMAGGESLAASLDHNREAWRTLLPDQREQFRNAVWSHYRKDPKTQEELLKKYNDFLSLDKRKREAYRRRAKWLKVAVATFTPAEREKLRKMSSIERAKALLARRDELVRQGKLTLGDSPRHVPAKSLDRPDK